MTRHQEVNEFHCKNTIYKNTIGSADIKNAELQIRGGTEDNSKIFFPYFSTKTYVVTRLEPFYRWVATYFLKE